MLIPCKRQTSSTLFSPNPRRILNRAIPKESKIVLKVDACPGVKGYGVLIVKNGKGLERFHINMHSAIRLVEEGYE